MKSRIDIVPLEGTYVFRPQSLSTCNTSNAASFMVGRSWRLWGLYINKRLYSWPKEKGSVETYELKEHIENCIKIDEGFYA